MPVVDYTKSRPALRARKAARYVRLYGPATTLSKIEGQYHMRGRVSPRRRSRDERAHVGIIGCGNFAYTTIAYHLERHAGGVIRGAMDIVERRAESLASRYGGHYATTDAARVLSDPAIDLIYVASNHASHADYAVRALDAGKSVHIEKPHVIDHHQLSRLCDAMARSSGRVRLGFNRPVSPFGRELEALVSRQAGPSSSSWFVVGYRLPPEHWYNDPGEGGRVLGNLCHWTDFVYRLVPAEQRHPIEIRPIRHDTDAIAVAFGFGDGSSATITFATSGEAFEGVREHLSMQRGEVSVELRDFQELRTHVGAARSRHVARWRQHGHEVAVIASYRMSARGGGAPLGETARYVWETGDLFLKTKDAVESDRRLVVEPAPRSVTGVSASRRSAGGR
jgi:predicted dehydrogenase